MAYTKTNWVNGTTPLNDKNMNKIENALENLDTNISKSTDEYSSTRTYSIGELVIYNNKLYKANQDITTAEAFNSSHWTEVTLLSDVNEIKSVVNNNADNLNKLNDAIDQAGAEIFVGAEEPTTGEKVWFNKDKNSIYVRNSNGVYEEFAKKSEEVSWKNIKNNIYYNKKDKFVNINSTNATWNITLTGYSYTTLGKLPTDYCPSRVITQGVFVRSKTPRDESLSSCYLEIGTDGTIKIFNWDGECTTQRILFNVSYCVD